MANGGGNQMEIMDFVALKLLSVPDATPMRRKHA